MERTNGTDYTNPTGTPDVQATSGPGVAVSYGGTGAGAGSKYAQVDGKKKFKYTGTGTPTTVTVNGHTYGTANTYSVKQTATFENSTLIGTTTSDTVSGNSAMDPEGLHNYTCYS